jgi:hypothetical protein
VLVRWPSTLWWAGHSLHVELQILREDSCDIPGAPQAQVARIVLTECGLRGHEDGFAIRIPRAQQRGPIGKLEDLIGWNLGGVVVEHDAYAFDGAAGQCGRREQHGKCQSVR